MQGAWAPCIVWILFQVGTAVIGNFPDLERKLGIGRYFEALTFTEGLPCLSPGQKHFHGAAEHFHDFGCCGVKFIIARHHDTEGFFSAVSKHDSATGDFAVEVNIGFFDDGNVFEFGHGLVLLAWYE